MILLFALFGCSSGENPLTPSGSSSVDNKSSDNQLASADIAGGASLMGLFEIALDLESETGEIISLRKSSLSDVLEVVDITSFMSVLPCIDCARIESVGFDIDGNVVLTIGIKHPFPAGDPLQPITGKNRSDLHLFNVEGILVAKGNGAPTSFTASDQTISDVPMLNPDGYTPYLDMYIDTILSTPATIHPYKLHFDDYSSGNYSAGNANGFSCITIPPPSGNLVMPMGSDYDVKDYILNIESGTTAEFYLAIGCTYGISTSTYEDRFDPVFRIPQYNKKAASEVEVEVTYNNLVAGVTASRADLSIKVLDMNHGVAIGAAIDNMLADSSVASIGIEIPILLSPPILVNSPVPVSGTGRDPLDPLTYNFEIFNSTSSPAGIYPGLVKVLDSYPPGLNTHPYIGSFDGAMRVPPTSSPLEGLFLIDEFATYQVFELEVGAEVADPIVTVFADPESGDAPLDVQFSVEVILAPGATIESYYWTSGDGGESDIPAPPYTYENSGIFTATCVVTDSFLNSGQDSIQINVNESGPQYAGSDTCQSCHNSVYSEWEEHGHHYAMIKLDGAAPAFPFSHVENPPPGSIWADFPYLIGGYALKANFVDSFGYVLNGPLTQYNLKSDSWAPYQSLAPPVENDCGACHSTGWQSFAENGGVHQDDLAGIMGTWNEEGIGCESCHGIGSEHIAAPFANPMIVDSTAENCGQCHSRQTTNRVYAQENLVMDQQQYNEFMASPHSGRNCLICHDSHAGSFSDGLAAGTGIVAACTDCHMASTHQVGMNMGHLACTDCHMPYGTLAAEYTNDGVHITGDLPSHIWSIDTIGITLESYFTTDGSDKWITPDVNDKVKLNLAYACMQCHDGIRAFELSNYSSCAMWADGIHD